MPNKGEKGLSQWYSLKLTRLATWVLTDQSNLEGSGTHFMSLSFFLRWWCRSTNYCNSTNQLQINQYFKPKPVTHPLEFLYLLPTYEPISTTMKLVWLVLVAYVYHWQWSRFKSTQTIWADLECGKGVPNKDRMLMSRKGVNWPSESVPPQVLRYHSFMDRWTLNSEKS